MDNLFDYILMYTVGGFTFPLLLITILFIHAYLVLPFYGDTTLRKNPDSIKQTGDDIDIIDAVEESLNEKLQSQDPNEVDVAAGYFTVSRNYIPGGVNGRLSERLTPIGPTIISTPSQSVYQSVYRSIFERKSSSSHEKNYGKPQKKGTSIFFVVLQHGHLLLFDDDEQLEVRHVVSLAHYDISIYSGGGDIPEGELFIKRNAICLSLRKDFVGINPDSQNSKPFYLFSDNCSAKEDFYFALMRNQENKLKPIQYEIKDIISLVQKLHSSEENSHTRWINAIIGRVFLALYKTSEIKNFFWAKIEKKISRVRTPTFLSDITLQDISMGDSAPIITNPKLRDLTVNGDLVVEADVRYSGNFRIEVAATARIDLGTRFRVREVNLLLAVNLKKILGHILLKIKPPPSNRFWFCFQTQPKIDMVIEPIVSSRQITYTLILRQIENRIKEVVAESIVYPNWDDSPFFGTENKYFRGGIWKFDLDEEKAQSKVPDTEVIEPGSQSQKNPETISDFQQENTSKTKMEEVLSKNEIGRSNKIASPTLSSRIKSPKSSSNTSLPSYKVNDLSTNADTSSNITALPQNLIRSGTFPSLSHPLVSTDNTTADAFKNSHSKAQNHAVAAFSALSQMNSAYNSGILSSYSSKSEKPKLHTSLSSSNQTSGKEQNTELSETQMDPTNASKLSKSSIFSPSPTGSNSNTYKSESFKRTSNTPSDIESSSEAPSSSFGQSSTAELKRISLVTMNNAAATAKKWGWSALHRNIDQKNDIVLECSKSRPLVMGQGQPLPPPGVPLPRPNRKKTLPTAVPKRKVIPPVSSQKLEETKLPSSTDGSPKQQSMILPRDLRDESQEKNVNHIKGTNDNLLLAQTKITGLGEELIEDEQSSITQPRNCITTTYSVNKTCENLDDDDQIIPQWLTAPD